MKLRMRPAGAFLLLAGVSACDIPTSVPRWDTTWIAPGPEFEMSVAEVLPSGIEVNDDTSAFVLSIDPVSESFTLGEMCSLCPAGSVTAPKPAFTYTVEFDVPLPSEVETVSIESGAIAVALAHGFGFDPLRPGVNADTGSITIEVRTGATVLATFVIDGRGRAFPPGQVQNLVLDIFDAEVGDTLTVAVTIESPAGDDATLDTSDELTIDVSSDGLEVSEIVLSLDAEPIEEETEFDLDAVDAGGRLKSGTLLMEIGNPFGVTGTVDLQVIPESGPAITRTVTLTGAATQDVVLSPDFTAADLERIVGGETTIRMVGAVGGDNITVRPNMVMTIAPRLRVTVEVGGESDSEGN